jgi:hypothetical protein
VDCTGLTGPRRTSGELRPADTDSGPPAGQAALIYGSSADAFKSESVHALVIEPSLATVALPSPSQRAAAREPRRSVLAGHAGFPFPGGGVVAVLVEVVFPAAITVEILDAVTDEMDVDTRLPAGGISHVHYEKDGRAHGVDVWESAEAFQTFAESTLQPATAKVAAARGIDLSQAGEPEISITEVHRVVH